MLQKAGLDVNQLKAHSTRAASTSAASRVDVPIEHILSTAGWKNEHTFFNAKILIMFSQVGRTEQSIKDWFRNRRAADVRRAKNKKTVLVPLVKYNRTKHLNTKQKEILEEFYENISKYPRLEDYMMLSVQVK